MNILNQKVIHVIYGNGTVVNQTERSIDVQFEDRKLTMAYPMAFDKHLTAADDQIQTGLLNEVQHIKAARAESRAFMLPSVSFEDGDAPVKHPANKKKDYIRIFEHTLDFCADNDTLRPAIRDINKNQVIYLESEKLVVSEPNGEESHRAEITISNKRSIEAASSYKDKKVCVLNFASGVSAGGGVRTGESSQEESLCRVSTLYKSLAIVDCWEKFYKPHKKASNFLNNDDIIYTPGVIVFKTDSEFPELMPEEDWFKIDVITCAAPKLKKKDGRNYLYENCSEGGISKDDLASLIEKRIERIFKVAHVQGAEVLILSAWGCGVYHNDKKMVAEAFRKAVDKYGSWFETIEFAIPATPTKAGNLQAFQKAFGFEMYESWTKKKFEGLESYYHNAADAYRRWESGTTWAYSNFNIRDLDIDLIYKYAVVCENGIEGIVEADDEEADDAYRLLFLTDCTKDGESAIKRFPDLLNHIEAITFEAHADWLCLYPRRLYELGMELRSMGMLFESYQMLEAGAEIDYTGRQSQYPYFCVADPQYELGNCYREGLGVAENYELAMHWYGEVCWSLDMAGLPVMGDMYLLGQGVEKSYKKALICYLRTEQEKGFIREALSYGFKDQTEKIFTGYSIENQLRKILANVNYEESDDETKEYLDMARAYLDDLNK